MIATWMESRDGRRLAESTDRLCSWWRISMKKMAKKQSASSRPAVRRPRSGKPTYSKSIRVVTSDELQSDPRLQDRIRRQIAKLEDAGPIDFSDAPALPPPAWENPI